MSEEPKFSDVLSIPSNPEDLFTLLYPIGTGGFGKVYKAMHNSTIKKIKLLYYIKPVLGEDEIKTNSYIDVVKERKHCFCQKLI